MTTTPASKVRRKYFITVKENRITLYLAKYQNGILVKSHVRSCPSKVDAHLSGLVWKLIGWEL